MKHVFIDIEFGRIYGSSNKGDFLPSEISFLFYDSEKNNMVINSVFLMDNVDLVFFKNKKEYVQNLLSSKKKSFSLDFHIPKHKIQEVKKTFYIKNKKKIVDFLNSECILQSDKIIFFSGNTDLLILKKIDSSSLYSDKKILFLKNSDKIVDLQQKLMKKFNFKEKASLHYFSSKLFNFEKDILNILNKISFFEIKNEKSIQNLFSLHSSSADCLRTFFLWYKINNFENNLT